MPRFYERYNKGLAPYPIPAWLWFGLMLFCVAAALPTYGISLVLLIAIAWDRQSRQDTTLHPAAKINEDLIEEDLRKGREKKRLDKNYVEQKDERSMYHRDWNPLGLPKNEWMALSSEERVAAYKNTSVKTRKSQKTIRPTFNTDRVVGATRKRPLGMGAGIAATSELTKA